MKKEHLTTTFAVLLLIFTVGFGCNFIRALKQEGNQNDREPSIETNTKITKDILRERLSRKNVNFIETSPSDKPNPLTLMIKILNGGSYLKVRLNNEEYDYDRLVSTLNLIFKERENNGAFREGTNEVDKRITLAASDDDIAFYEEKNIVVEDFEKLIDDLRKEGIDQISINFADEPSMEISPPLSNKNPKRISELDEEPPPPAPITPKPVPKIVSGGVLNGKAVNLVKPSYPAAARAVKASGAVNVQVTIDEQGNVISASAVSGHPLLRASSVQAARASKFSATMLSGQPVKVTGIIVYNFPAPE